MKPRGPHSGGSHWVQNVKFIICDWWILIHSIFQGLLVVVTILLIDSSVKHHCYFFLTSELKTQ